MSYNKHSNEKQVGSIFRTKNYEKFKFNAFNREIKQAHIKWLSEQMLKYGFIKGKAITCNEKYEIIDGHHRFLTAKTLGIPFDYEIIKGGNEDLLQLSNVGQNNWDKKNFTNFWALKGNENYIALKNFMEKYPKYHITQALILLMNEPNAHPKTKVFQNGEFKIASLKKAEDYAQKIEKLAEVFPKAYQSKFMSALICCETRSNNFSFAEFYEKLKKFPDKLTPSITTKSYLEKFEEIYNYHRPKKNFVKLADLSADHE
jgi:hypothetical protein